jgi:hypothetical protein
LACAKYPAYDDPQRRPCACTALELAAMPFQMSRHFAQLMRFAVMAITVAATPVLAQTPLRGGAVYNQRLPPGPPGMDTFSSGGGSRGNTTYRTGTQTFQPNDGPCSSPFGCARGGPGYLGGTGRDVYCQDSPGMPQRGPYSHTGTNTPCGLGGGQMAPQPPPAPMMVRPSFNYYYINGINTPDRPPAGTKGPARGNYQWDWKLIRGNLLDLQPYMGLGRPTSPLVSIRVTDETDHMDVQTQNFSGKDPVSSQPLDMLCSSAQILDAISRSGGGRSDNSPLGVAVAVCGIYNQMVAGVNNLRGGGMAPGDLLECFRQALAFDLAPVAASLGLPAMPSGIDAFSSQQPEVRKVSSLILAKFRAERAQNSTTPVQNYFIVIGHSQGNFFVEAVGYRLLHYEGPDGAYIFHNRLGLLSFASPTDYSSVTGEPGFANRVEHIKRQDDMINALLALPRGVGKHPWTTGDFPALWPLGKLDWSNWNTARTAISAMVGPPPPQGCQPAGTPQCDGALYIPFLNSHLLENYIADANFTMPGQPISPDVGRQLGQIGPSTFSPQSAAPLLKESREALVRLKRAMLSGSTTSYAPQDRGVPMPQGADLGRAASGMLLRLLGQ